MKQTTSYLLKQAKTVLCFVLTAIFLLGMVPTVMANNTDYEELQIYEHDSFVHEDGFDEYTNDLFDEIIELEARIVPGQIVTDGSSTIIFNNNGFDELIMPESVAIATPHQFVLEYEKIPFHVNSHSEFEFRGWLHPESVQVIMPGQTVAIIGTGVIELFALFDQADQYMPEAHVSAASSQHPNITNPASKWTGGASSKLVGKMECCKRSNRIPLVVEKCYD